MPAFVSAGESDGVEVDTSSPDYDPNRIYQLIGVRGLFQQEPRNEPWARPVEAWFAASLEKDLRRLLPGVTDVSVTCKTSTCRFSWSPHDPATDEKVLVVYRQLYSGTAADGGSGSLAGVYSPPRLAGVKLGDPQSLIDFVGDRRRKFLDYVATPRGKTDPVLKEFYDLAPPEKWVDN